MSKGEWEKVLSAFPGQLPLARLPAAANPTYSINIRLTNREAKCAVCKKMLVHGDLRASTEGPYRTIERKWNRVGVFQWLARLARLARIDRTFGSLARWLAHWPHSLKLQERLPTINKTNIIRRNIYRDNIFHSRRQVLKCLKHS